jgi:hypothetical protein
MSSQSETRDAPDVRLRPGSGGFPLWAGETRWYGRFVGPTIGRVSA